MTRDDAAAARARRRPRAFRLRVSLRDVRPEIWRSLVARSDMTLAEFHEVLRILMGWTGMHLHEYRPAVADDEEGQVDSVSEDDESSLRLYDFLDNPGDRLLYLYDFGDGWEHDVVLEEALGLDHGQRYPAVLDGARACPPEDVGGPPGYEEFLEILADETHPDHDERLDWCGGFFDPETFDVEGTNRRLAEIAR